jgi:hypothetical protein
MNTQPAYQVAPVGVLLTRTVALYRRHARLVLLTTLPVVAFVEILVAVGLGEFTASAHKKIPTGDLYIDFAASVLVTAPLVTAMIARTVVADLAGDAHPRTVDIVVRGLDLFAAAFAAEVLFWSGVLLGAFILIVPGIIFLVSWYFVVQTVAIDDKRLFATVAMSSALVRGLWWRTAGTLLVLQLLAAVPSLVATAGFEALSTSVDSDAVTVVGNIIIGTIALPFVAIGATLYYLELRARAGMPAPR